MTASVMDHIALQLWQLFQEEGLKVNWQENQDSSMVERQASSSPSSGTNFSLEIYNKI